MMDWLPPVPLIAHFGLIFIIFNMLVLSAAFMVWMERKVCAYIQDRVGPNRVGAAGWLQPFADVIKLLTKEELRPKAAEVLRIDRAVQHAGHVHQHQAADAVRIGCGVRERDGAAHGVADQHEGARHARRHHRLDDAGVVRGRVEMIALVRLAEAGKIQREHVVALRQSRDQLAPVARAVLPEPVDQDHRGPVAPAGTVKHDIAAEDGFGHQLAARAARADPFRGRCAGRNREGEEQSEQQDASHA